MTTEVTSKFHGSNLRPGALQDAHLSEHGAVGPSKLVVASDVQDLPDARRSKTLGRTSVIDLT